MEEIHHVKDLGMWSSCRENFPFFFPEDKSETRKHLIFVNTVSNVSSFFSPQLLLR